MTAELQIRLLGGLQITQGEAPVTGFMSNKAPALLAYLAVTRRPHSRDALAGLLWGDLPEADAKNNLRQTLSNLRRFFEPHLLITRELVAFNAEAPHFLDTAAFEHHLQAAAQVGPETRPTHWREAASLYRGDFLSGFFLRDAPDFDEWVVPLKARFRELALQALHALTTFHNTRAEYATVIDYATRLLALDAWREEAHRQLMSALARSGQRSAALAQYETCRRMLEKELGVKPSAETTVLYERIRAAGEAVKPTLPTPVAPLIGRATELNDIVARLLDPHCRLLTLIGLGGSGKTRLALAVAAHLRDSFLNGVVFVPLVNVIAPEQLPHAIAEALRLSMTGDDVLGQLHNYLAEKEILLVLDNFEQLASAKTGLTALASLLERAPEAKILITSHARLNLHSEWLHEVRPLSREAATLVFRHYAGRVAPTARLEESALPAIRRVCEAVGQLPLAVALAAGWARRMPCEEIAQALERDMALLSTSMPDAPERHRSMSAVFKHSWHLLSADEQRVLAALSVFRGGFMAEAAQFVAGASGVHLSGLADKSWLQHSSTQRFELHELARQYAQGQLPHAEPVLEQHCAYYANLLAAREPFLRSVRQSQILDELRPEADNLRLMWQTAVRHHRGEILNKTLVSVCWLMDVTGRYSEGVHMFGEAINSLSAQPGTEAVRARLLARRGSLARLVGLYAEAEAWFTEAEALSRAVGDIANQAYALRQLGFFPLVRGEIETGLARLYESLRLYRLENDLPRVADACLSVGIAELRLGHFEQAQALYQEAAEILTEVGDEMGQAVAQSNLGDLTYFRGQRELALDHYRAAAEIQRRYADRRNLAISLNNIACVLTDMKQWVGARLSAQESADIFREFGNRAGLMHALQSLAGAALGQGEVDMALARFNEGLNYGLQLDAEADVLTGLVLGAQLLQARGQMEEAARLLVSIQRHPATPSFTVTQAEAALAELPARVTTDAQASAVGWSVSQMVEVLQSEAAHA